jgi:mycoredoxin-dependent peroxiredoxin
VLGVGVRAPDFSLKDQHGRTVTLGSFAGVQPVLLVFYPLAFTGICQQELDDLQRRRTAFAEADLEVLAVSVGPPPTHKVWAAQSGFTFPLLSDFWPHGEVAQAYGVFNDDTGFANRGTFAVDRAGIIRFAEVCGPGELREPEVWAAAVAALKDFPSPRSPV